MIGLIEPQLVVLGSSRERLCFGESRYPSSGRCVLAGIQLQLVDLPVHLAALAFGAGLHLCQLADEELRGVGLYLRTCRLGP